MSEAINNLEARKESFAYLLDALLAGGNQAVVQQFLPMAKDATAEDLMSAIDAAVVKEIPFGTLKPAVSRLINLMASGLKAHHRPLPESNLFLRSLSAENAALLDTLAKGKPLMRALNAIFDGDRATVPNHSDRDRAEPAEKAMPDASTPAGDRAATSHTVMAGTAAALRAVIAEIGAVERHYRKKENILFPWIEANIADWRCIRLMWEIHDDARTGLKTVEALLDDLMYDRVPNLPAYMARLNEVVGRLYFDLNAMAFREEYALFPAIAFSMDVPADRRMYAESDEYGWAFLGRPPYGLMETIQATSGDRASAGSATETASGDRASARYAVSGTECTSSTGKPSDIPVAYQGRTGALSPEVLTAMFSVLPVDMTWVDANDKVRWFSDSPHRIFPRSPSIIGRDVRNCHPGASVGRVVSVIEALRSGQKDSESFWITMAGKFIHIAYYALRTPDGAYLGVLEASQDLTSLRSLTGEKRLSDN